MKIKLTIEVEYETNPSWYPENATPLSMAEIDLENDPGAFFADATYTIVGAEEI